MLHSRLEAEMLARTMRTGRSVRQNIALRVADAVTGAGMDDAYARLGSGRDWAVARREEASGCNQATSCWCTARRVGWARLTAEQILSSTPAPHAQRGRYRAAGGGPLHRT